MRSIYASSLLPRAGRTLGCLVALAISLELPAEDPEQPTEPLSSLDAPSALIMGDADDRKPHPWLENAPPALARLVDTGNVQISVDPMAVDAAARTALTVFTFDLKYRMRFRLNELPRTRDEKRSVRIAVSFHDVECSVAHRILLSDRFRPIKPWETALVQHEFDHVAISTDPRLFAVLRSLNGEKWNLVATPDPATPITEIWAKSEIETAVAEFQRTVERLVQQYYTRLDELSKNGLEPIAKRADFFAKLYSKDDLEQIPFPHRMDAAKHLKEIEFHQVLQHHRLP